MKLDPRGKTHICEVDFGSSKYSVVHRCRINGLRKSHVHEKVIRTPSFLRDRRFCENQPQHGFIGLLVSARQIKELRKGRYIFFGLEYIPYKLQGLVASKLLAKATGRRFSAFRIFENKRAITAAL